MTYFSKIEFVQEDPKIKKKGPNGFIKFRNEYWKSFKKDNPDVTTQQFSSIAADAWKNLSNAERIKYIKMSEDEKKTTNVKTKKKRHVRRKKKRTEGSREDTQSLLPVDYTEMFFPNVIFLDYFNYVLPSPPLTPVEQPSEKEFEEVLDFDFMMHN